MSYVDVSFNPLVSVIMSYFDVSFYPLVSVIMLYFDVCFNPLMSTSMLYFDVSFNPLVSVIMLYFDVSFNCITNVAHEHNCLNNLEEIPVYTSFLHHYTSLSGKRNVAKQNCQYYINYYVKLIVVRCS